MSRSKVCSIRSPVSKDGARTRDLQTVRAGGAVEEAADLAPPRESVSDDYLFDDVLLIEAGRSRERIITQPVATDWVQDGLFSVSP